MPVRILQYRPPHSMMDFTPRKLISLPQWNRLEQDEMLDLRSNKRFKHLVRELDYYFH